MSTQPTPDEAPALRMPATAALYEEPSTTPTVGGRYVKRVAPGAGRVVTVTRVWTDTEGTAVAYEWRDDTLGHYGSACPLDVFQSAYRPTTEPAAGDSEAQQ
jgi:hypothetical protein